MEEKQPKGYDAHFKVSFVLGVLILIGMLALGAGSASGAIKGQQWYNAQKVEAHAAQQQALQVERARGHIEMRNYIYAEALKSGELVVTSLTLNGDGEMVEGPPITLVVKRDAP